jgi:peptide/nickel transport system permease protein
VLLALVGPVIAPHSPTQLVGIPFQAPSRGAPLGTDYVGEDVLSRVLSGGRSVLWMAIGAGLIGAIVGSTLGVIAGYGGKWFDEPIMRSLDVLLAVPVMMFVLLFIAMLGSSRGFIMVLVGVAWVPSVARTIRAATLELAEREFIQAAKVIGTPRWQILLHDVLPNLLSLAVVELGVRCAWSVSLVSVISFLGFGLSPPNVDWGLMSNENRIGIGVQPWGVVAPVVCIALFSVGVNLMADGLGRAVSGVERRGET